MGHTPRGLGLYTEESGIYLDLILEYTRLSSREKFFVLLVPSEEVTRGWFERQGKIPRMNEELLPQHGKWSI